MNHDDTINSDPDRKAVLRQALSELEDRFDLPTVYCIGFASLIRDEHYDANATGEEVKAILEENGLQDGVTPAFRKELSVRENLEMNARITPEQRALLARRFGGAPPNPTWGGYRPAPGSWKKS